MGAVSHLIRNTPGPARRLLWAAVPFARRRSRVYRDWLAFLRASQWWTPDQLRAWQLRRLRGVLIHAYAQTPYYRHVFDACGLSPYDMALPDDLARLLVLTKDDVRAHADDLRAPASGASVTLRTSGSTGEPLTIVAPRAIYDIEAAFLRRAYAAHGTALNDERTAWLRRYAAGDADPLWYDDHELRRRYLAANRLSPATVRDYVAAIDASGARCLSGYPSSLYSLAALLEETGLALHNVNVCHAASETMLPAWRDAITRAIAPVCCHYGMQERVAFFFQCAYGRYHEAVEYGYTEIVDGQVVATGFHNPAMPLIRYATGDTATSAEAGVRCPCGRGLPVSVRDFAGRVDDILVTPDGRRVPGVNFYTMFYKIPGVRMFKIVQRAPDLVEVQVVPGPGYGAATVEWVEQGMRARLGDAVRIIYRRVPEIARNPRTGKVRCIEGLARPEGVWQAHDWRFWRD